MKHSAQDYEVRLWYSPADKGFVAQVVDMPGVSAVGDTREDAAREIQVALDLALRVYAEDGIAPPAPHNPAASILGHLGGRVISLSKRKAAQRNGRKGGRPRKMLQPA